MLPVEEHPVVNEPQEEMVGEGNKDAEGSMLVFEESEASKQKNA